MSSIHQQIRAELARQYGLFDSAVLVSPSGLAHRVFEVFASGDEDAHIQYVSLEHLKQMARAFLRRQHDPDSDESEAYDAQGSLFSGVLQDRYPLPRKGDEEPVYKLRQHLTPEERAWNVEQLRKSAGARLKHADALEGEGRSAA